MEKMTPNAWLRAELSKRQSANPRYSLRSFAKAIQVQPGRLSEWLSDKREISMASLKSVTQVLGYSPAESAALAGSLYQQKAKQEMMPGNEQQSRHLLLNDQFQLVKEPYHYALMELVHTKGFREEYSWIAARLKIAEIQAKGGVERLLRVGLLERNSKQQLVHAHVGSTTTQDIPSVALRASHRKTLEDAIDALENVAVEERDISSITVAVDTAKLPMAKQMIRDFRRQLAEVLSSGTKNEVYNLNIQLVPTSFHCNEKQKRKTSIKIERNKNGK